MTAPNHDGGQIGKPKENKTTNGGATTTIVAAKASGARTRVFAEAAASEAILRATECAALGGIGHATTGLRCAIEGCTRSCGHNSCSYHTYSSCISSTDGISKRGSSSNSSSSSGGGDISRRTTTALCDSRILFAAAEP